MYAAILPVSFTYFLLWNPPAWGQAGLFCYVLVLAVLIRTFITFFETPSAALGPELTHDYDERTALMSWRQFFGWMGGNLMSVLMFGVLLVATPQYPVGTLNRDGYATYGIIASLLMMVAMLVTALGTHNRIASFAKPPPRRKLTLRQLFGEARETLGDRSFVALFVATIFGAIAGGLGAALVFLMATYFWGFSTVQIFISVTLVFVSAIAAAFIGPPLARRLGKKRAVVLLGIIAFGAAPVPVLLRLMGLMPANGDPLLFPIVTAVGTIDTALIIAYLAISASMVADLVEAAELRTGRRTEGLFYAALTFTRKATGGLGALAAGLLLSFVGFPKGAAASAVPESVLWNLGALYVPMIWLLWGAMIAAISFYRIDRAGHASNVRQLAERAAALRGA
jgi:Na+/melibiose symporter-like transporter